MFAKHSVARQVVPVFTVLALLAWVGVGAAQEVKPEPPKAKDIVDVARGTDNLKTFCKLLETAGLVDALKAKGPFTVFAPTDEAFKKLGAELEELQKPENKARLQKILKNHVVPEKKLAADLKTAKNVKSLGGDEIAVWVMEEKLMVGKSMVLKADIDGANGVIHQIDAVLLPREKPEPREKPAKPEG